MDEKKWEERLNNILSKRRQVNKRRKDVALKNFFKSMFALVSVEIVLGCIAAYLMWRLYGVMELLKIILSWTIGMTIMTTFVTALLRKYHKEHN